MAKTFLQRISRLFAKAEWRLVKRIDAGYTVRNQATGKITSDKCVLTYYLYEDQFGNRKFDAIDSEEGDLDIGAISRSHWTFRNSIYRDTVRPWLDGRLDPDIPSYEQIPKDDFQNSLAGKKVK